MAAHRQVGLQQRAGLLGLRARRSPPRPRQAARTAGTESLGQNCYGARPELTACEGESTRLSGGLCGEITRCSQAHETALAALALRARGIYQNCSWLFSHLSHSYSEAARRFCCRKCAASSAKTVFSSALLGGHSTFAPHCCCEAASLANSRLNRITTPSRTRRSAESRAAGPPGISAAPW